MLLDSSDPVGSLFQQLLRPISSSESDYSTHSIHPYPAKFLPHYPKFFIQHFSGKNDIILDPMCGAGTTLIEALLAQRRFIGIDIDPLAVLISKVATSRLPRTNVNAFTDAITRKFKAGLEESGKHYEGIPTEVEFPNRHIWFRPEVLREVCLLRDVIISESAEQGLKNLGMLALSSVLRDVSNADPRDIFPERDMKEPIRRRQDVLGLFHKSLMKIKRQVVSLNDQKLPTLGEVIHGDARTLPLSDESIDVTITSPPYSYAMDYQRVHKFSLLLLLQSKNEYDDNAKRYIGTDRLLIAPSPSDFAGLEPFKEQIQRIYEKDKRWGQSLYFYAIGLREMIIDLSRVTRRGGRFICIVGNSTVKGEEFDAAGLVSTLANNSDFRLERSFNRPYYAYRMARKRNIQSNTIKSDNFLVFKR